MANYWCETCCSESFKTVTQLLGHLSGTHGINVKERGYFFKWGINGYAGFSCIVCAERLGEKFDRDSFKKHARKHAKYLLDNKQFPSLLRLLHYIDKKYGVHCCYMRHVFSRRKTIFLDGITK